MTSPPGHVVVVGAGAFGAAAALELRVRGWQVTLVDEGPLPREGASSTDVSKVVRMDYGADAFYHELAEVALEGWDRWNRDWPLPLYHQDGLLVLATGEMEPGGFEHDSWATLTRRGYRPDRIGADELGARFPAWNPKRFPFGYLSARAGWAESGRTVARLLELGQGAGVRLRPGAMRSLLERGSAVGGVVLAGSGDTIAADRVLVSAGAWTPTLLPWIADRMWAVGQPVLHFRPHDAAPFRRRRFPPWAADIANSGWYGFPALPDGRVKVGHHGPGTRVHPDRRGDVPADHVARTRAFLQDALPDLATAPVVGQRVCMYCDTFDGDLFVDADPDRHGLVVAAGGSGHAFKFAPVMGGLIADVVEGRANRWAARFRWRDSGSTRTEEARFSGG